MVAGNKELHATAGADYTPATGDLTFDSTNPPLLKIVMALPLTTMDVKLDLDPKFARGGGFRSVSEFAADDQDAVVPLSWVDAAMLRWQFANAPQVLPEHVVAAFSGMVLPPKAAQFAGLAASSGRSLFVYGPPGNGKSTLGRSIQNALQGDYWIPYAVNLGETVIRLYDPHVHQRVEIPADKTASIDQRWVRIRRPVVIVGGELTLDMLDLSFNQISKFHEAPLQMKAIGGIFVIDDFGIRNIIIFLRVNKRYHREQDTQCNNHQLDYVSTAHTSSFLFSKDVTIIVLIVVVATYFRAALCLRRPNSTTGLNNILIKCTSPPRMTTINSGLRGGRIE